MPASFGFLIERRWFNKLSIGLIEGTTFLHRGFKGEFLFALKKIEECLARVEVVGVQAFFPCGKHNEFVINKFAVYDLFLKLSNIFDDSHKLKIINMPNT